MSGSVSSVGSCVSEMSVSVFGEELTLGEATDRVFKELQISINNTHCRIRELICDIDRDENFEILYGHKEQVDIYADEISALFKELKSITSQIVKPETAEEKAYVKQKKEELKEKKAKEKEAMKLLKQKEKELDAAMAMASIRE